MRRDFRADRSGRTAGGVMTLLQRLFAQSSLYAAITSALTLQKGTGAVSFTRASGETIIGYAPTAVAGDAMVQLTLAVDEAGFAGARRISQGVWSEVLADGTPIPANLLKGISVEPDSQNVIFPSATLTTQSQTVAAGTWTLSFYGTGSVVMSGTATGTLAGTGAANRVQLTVTATAGSVTFTVTGSVTDAQFEPLPYASSVIPTTTGVVARTKDIITLPTAGNLVAAQGAISLIVTPDHSLTDWRVFITLTGGSANGFYLSTIGGNLMIAKRVAGADSFAYIPLMLTKGVTAKIAMRWNGGDFSCASNGVVSTRTVETTPVPVPSQMEVGAYLQTAQFGGNIKDIRCFQTDLSDADLTRITS